MGLRLAGFLLLLACGFAFGDMKARRFAARYNDLCAMRHALLLLETYVSRTAQPFPRALSSVGQGIRGPTGRLLCAVSAELVRDSRLTLALGWDRALSRLNMGDGRHSLPGYSSDDLDVLGRLFGVLGTGGRDDQVSHIRLARETLEMNEESARRDLDTYPRLWRYLGVMGATTLALVAI